MVSSACVARPVTLPFLGRQRDDRRSDVRAFHLPAFVRRIIGSDPARNRRARVSAICSLETWLPPRLWGRVTQIAPSTDVASGGCGSFPLTQAALVSVRRHHEAPGLYQGSMTFDGTCDSPLRNPLIHSASRERSGFACRPMVEVLIGQVCYLQPDEYHGSAHQLGDGNAARNGDS